MEIENNTGKSYGSAIAAVIITLVVALACIGVAFGQRISHKRKAERYQKVTGRIADVEKTFHKGKTTQYPVYEYVVDGQTYRYTANSSSGVQIEVGRHVTIYYDPENPNEAYTDDRTSSLFLPLLIMGGFFGAIGLLILVNVVLNIPPQLRGFLTGIFIAAVFCGIPVGVFLLHVELNLFKKIALIVLMAIGILCLMGAFISLFSDPETLEKKKNESYKKIEIIGNKATEFTEKEKEKIQRVKVWYRRISIILSVCLLVGMVIFIVVLINKSKNSSDGELTEELIAKSVGCSVETLPEYVVFERVVTKIVGDRYYFEATAGLPNSVGTKETYSVGQHVYWIEVIGRNPILCDMEKFSYNGDRIPANSGWYNAEGKCYLTKDFLRRYLEGEPEEVVSVTVTEMTETGIEAEFEDGSRKKLKIAEETRPYYDDIAVGDTVYWVRTSNGGAAVFSTKMYCTE